MARPAKRPKSDDQAVLLRDDAGGIATLTMNRPRARNALSRELIAALSEEFAAIEADAAVRVVVIAANGPAFCAGHDMKEMRADPDQNNYESLFAGSSRLMQAIMQLSKPVIAKVAATATAAGTQMVASCDLAIASRDARFATPGVDIGLFCSTPMVAISRNMTRKQSLEMLLTGVPIDAETAAAFGLINKAVAAEDLDATVADMAATIVQKSARVIALGKQAYYRQLEMGLPEAYAFAGQVMASNMMMADATEGIDAFLEKRPPRWPEG
jgi:enoyl-CoA hydratase/carnithine racemase